MPPRAQPRGGAAAAEDEDEQEELVNDEEKDDLGEQSAVLSSYTTESGLSCLNVYRPASQAKDPTANRYYGCLSTKSLAVTRCTKRYQTQVDPRPSFLLQSGLVWWRRFELRRILKSAWSAHQKRARCSGRTA